MNVRVVATETQADLRVAACVERAAREFAGLGIERINLVCNARRAYLLTQVDRVFLNQYGLAHLSPEQASRELERPFTLQAVPDELVIDFSTRASEVSGRPMSAWRPMIWIHMAAIEADRLFCPSVQLSVEDATLHEMLHICGDTAGDGIVRHNWAGIIPIRELLTHHMRSTAPCS